MAKKKQLDKLSLDMIECQKAGFGVHYGAWKATQIPKKIEPKGLPDGWKKCAYCGKPFKPKTKRIQYYCEAQCQAAAQREKDKDKRAIYKREWKERNVLNG